MKGCAVRIGYYYRVAVVIGFRVYHAVPIARWRCRGKGHCKHPHRTFSLLPHMLVPYQRYDIMFIYETVKSTIDTTASTDQTLEIMSERGVDDAIIIESRHIRSFQNLFIQAYQKCIMFGDIQMLIQKSRIAEPVAAVCAVIDAYLKETRCHLSSAIPSVERAGIVFYYHSQYDRPYRDRFYLFGTPTQKRSGSTSAGFT